MAQETYELPGGKVEPGENPEHAIIREVWEETGNRVTDVQPLGSFTVAGRSILVDLFFTDKVERTEAQHMDEDEDIEVIYCPLDRLQQKVWSGQWPDLRLAIALAMARSRNLL